MKRSVLGIIFALTLLIGLFPALAAAESEDVTATEVESTSVESTEEVNALADESLPSETEAATQAVTETATATQTETVVVTETATMVVTETATATATETETVTATATQTDTPTETATATPIIIPAEASIGGTMECTYVTASIIGDTYTADEVLIQLIGNYSDGSQVYIFNDTVPYTGDPFIWNYEYEANG